MSHSKKRKKKKLKVDLVSSLSDLVWDPFDMSFGWCRVIVCVVVVDMERVLEREDSFIYRLVSIECVCGVGRFHLHEQVQFQLLNWNWELSHMVSNCESRRWSL